MTGSISQVGGDEIKKLAAANLTNTLAGKTAGVIANTRSGEPGEDNADILIRGKGTLGSTAPLIVVDGIADRSFSRLNPEDIESISVLKDASAAIYGARAANGVILVTTKRGAEGKVKVNYSGNVSFSQPTRIPEMLNSYQYATYVNEFDAAQGNTPTYSETAMAKILDGSDPISFPDTDWWDSVTKNWATNTQHSLSVSGGNDKLSFYSSAQYAYQDAIYKNTPQDIINISSLLILMRRLINPLNSVWIFWGAKKYVIVVFTLRKIYSDTSLLPIRCRRLTIRTDC